MGDSVWTRSWEQANDSEAHPVDPWEPPRRGDAVLVLGAAAGDECVRAAAEVGPQGRVIGIETTDEQLALSRARIPAFAKREGYENLTFRKARLDTQWLLQNLMLGVVITIVGWRYISWQGHLGGFLGGVAAAAIIAYAPHARRSLVQWVGLGVVTAVLLALAVVRAASLA